MQITLSIIPLKYKEYIEENNLPDNELTLRKWKNNINNLGLKPKYKTWLKRHELKDSYTTLLQYKDYAETIIALDDMIKDMEED